MAVLPDVSTEATISPLYRSGDQASPAEYRPVSVLEHLRKTIDATIVTYVCDRFSLA